MSDKVQIQSNGKRQICEYDGYDIFIPKHIERTPETAAAVKKAEEEFEELKRKLMEKYGL